MLQMLLSLKATPSQEEVSGVQFGCKQQKKIIAYSLSIAQLKALSPNYISQYIFHLSAKDSTPIEEL